MIDVKSYYWESIQLFKMIFWICVLTLMFAVFVNFLPYILVIVGSIAIYYVGYRAINYIKHGRYK